MDQRSQNSVPVKSSPLTKTDVERKSRKSMSFILLIQPRAVLVLESQQSVGPLAPAWIQSYNSPHMAGIGFKKIPNSLPAWQVALASIVSPSHFHPVEIDGAQYHDVNSVGYVDLCAAVYADVSYGRYVRLPIAVSIGSENPERSNAKRSKIEYFENHTLAGYASNVSQSYNEELHRYYKFKVPKSVPGRSSRSIGKIKAVRQSIEKKLPTSIKHILKVLRGSNSRQQIEKLNDESNRTASITDISTKDVLGRSAKGHKTLNYITKFTEAYILRDDVQTRISECAQTLVERRRHLAQVNPTRWKRQCYGLRYQCVHGDCVGDDGEYADRDILACHVLRAHQNQVNLFTDNLTSMLNDCMSVVL